MSSKKFELGHVVRTQGVDELMQDGLDVIQYLDRHQSWDWWEQCPEDNVLNDHAWLHGNERIFSVYHTDQGKIWIITEYDRSATTVLLPSEY